ncbi:hypothetical protein GCM10023085_75750 [Actinomadura viridis]
MLEPVFGVVPGAVRLSASRIPSGMNDFRWEIKCRQIGLASSGYPRPPTARSPARMPLQPVVPPTCHYCTRADDAGPDAYGRPRKTEITKDSGTGIGAGRSARRLCRSSCVT